MRELEGWLGGGGCCFSYVDAVVVVACLDFGEGAPRRRNGMDGYMD